MGQTPGGYPYPIMLCNISQNAMGQTLHWTLPGPAGGGGYPARSSWGGTLSQGSLPGGYPAGGVPCWGVPCRGGVTQLGQQKEYSLHGGQYASCVHAGGLSCLEYFALWFTHTVMISYLLNFRNIDFSSSLVVRETVYIYLSLRMRISWVQQYFWTHRNRCKYLLNYSICRKILPNPPR